MTTDETIRKACDLLGPEFVETLAKANARPGGSAILRDLASGAIPIVRKAGSRAGHDGRQHPETGRFTPMRPGEARVVKTPGSPLPVTVQDTREGIPWLLDGVEREPTNSPQDGPNAYGEAADKPDADPQGLAERNRRTLNL